MANHIKPYDQIVYLLQGGGALGSYQVGVCQVLLENDLPPDWVVGTSIGAINASIIVGNKPEDRIAKLIEFWDSISYPLPSFIGVKENLLLQQLQNYFHSVWIASYGLPHFFRPRIVNPWIFFASSPDKISFYDTSELRETLKKVINFDLINQKKIRLTLGAVRIKGGQAVRFDNFHQLIGPEHIRASSALPPGFPAIKIEGEYYWDGGLLSNTPFSVIFEEKKIPQKFLCFIVNLYTYPRHIPRSLMDVIKYKKEISFANRHQKALDYFIELHYLEHSLNVLAKTITDNPDLERALNAIKQSGHPGALNIVRFHYQDPRSNVWSKDFNFSQVAVQEHWQRGLEDAKKAFVNRSWLDAVIDDSGVVTHKFYNEEGQ